MQKSVQAITIRRLQSDLDKLSFQKSQLMLKMNALKAEIEERKANLYGQMDINESFVSGNNVYTKIERKSPVSVKKEASIEEIQEVDSELVTFKPVINKRKLIERYKENPDLYKKFVNADNKTVMLTCKEKKD